MMQSLDFSSVLLQLLAWLFVTFMGGVCLDKLAQRNALPVSAWWSGLAITILVFIPTSSFITANVNIPSWVQSESVLIGFGRNMNDVVSIHQAADSNLAKGLVLLLAALVSLWRLVKLCHEYIKVKRLIMRAIPYHSDICYYPIFLTPLNTSAFAMGIFKPIVALPNYFLSLPQDQQNILLEHESMHIKLGDTIAVIFWRVLCAACWFNPFLRKLEAGINQSFELRCDERTIQKRQCSPIEYAQALLNCLRLGANTETIGLSLGFSEHKLSFRDYKKRLKSIVAGPSHSNLLRTSLLLIALAASVFGISSACAAMSGSQETWVRPVAQFNISSEFGNIASIRGNKSHRGIDLVGPIGTPVYASASGKVMIADDISLAKAYGKVVVLQHPQEWQSMYAHLSQVSVKPGQYVLQGDIIGLIGQSGKVTGPHLHFELAHQQKPVDPKTYFQKKSR